MKSLMRLVLAVAIGVVVGLTATPGTVEATIAKEVPIDEVDGGRWSHNDEGYLEIDKHFTRGHVDMWVGPVRICGSFPFYWPCTSISYWVPKWLSEVAVMTKPQAGSGVPNEAGKGRFFLHARTKAVWTGPIPTGDPTKAFLMPCTRNNACLGIPTPEASPAMLPSYVDFFYDSREDRCWSDETILQCGDKSGSGCPFNSFQAEMGGGISPATTSTSCKMKPLGAFDFWRIAPPFGNWGRAIPRTGHVIHSNKIAASGLAALRAFNISRYPVEVWPQEGFMRMPLSHPAVDGPAPIGQPAIFPWVGPFPCNHLMDNDRTGLRGTMAFPAGVDLGSVFGGNYCRNTRDRSSAGLHHNPQPDLSTPDPDDTTAENSAACNRQSWKDFEAYNSSQAQKRRKMMVDDDSITAAQAQNAHPPDLEIFLWVYWRFRRCTCPWPSPSWAYAEWFKSQSQGWGDNSCVKPGNLAALPKKLANLAGKTLREAGKAALDKAKQEAQAIGLSVDQTQAVEGLKGMVGDLGAAGDIGGTGGEEILGLHDPNERGDGVAETSSTLGSFTSLTGGNEDINAVSGNSQVSGGLQNQHTVSLQGPSTNAASTVAQGIPAGVVDAAARPALQTAIETAMTTAENLVFSGTDVEAIEETEVDRFNPPGNRFGDGSYAADPFADCTADCPPPLASECQFSSSADCNDGDESDWNSIGSGVDMNADYTQPQMPDDVVTVAQQQNVGSGICDEPETERCAAQNCAWRQCALGSTRIVCTPEDAGRCPPVLVCSGDPTVCEWVDQCCTVCCNYGEVVSGQGGSLAGGGTHCTTQRGYAVGCGPKEDCDYFHRHGCCLANNPGGLVQLELDTIGFRNPALPPTYAAQCTPDSPDLSSTCFGREEALCPNTTGTCSWAPEGC